MYRYTVHLYDYYECKPIPFTLMICIVLLDIDIRLVTPVFAIFSFRMLTLLHRSLTALRFLRLFSSLSNWFLISNV